MGSKTISVGREHARKRPGHPNRHKIKSEWGRHQKQKESRCMEVERQKRREWGGHDKVGKADGEGRKPLAWGTRQAAGANGTTKVGIRVSEKKGPRRESKENHHTVRRRQNGNKEQLEVTKTCN